MPRRSTPLVTGEIYHIYNRGIDKKPTFTSKLEYKRALLTMRYYRFDHKTIRLSQFLQLNSDERTETLERLENSDMKNIDILCYCLMPNHFHILVRQRIEHGISRFMSNFQNSYTRFSNLRHKHEGSLFLDQCKAKRIEDDTQLLHVNRYIHLNPYTSYVVNTLEEVCTYLWSSMGEYLRDKVDCICDVDTVMRAFRNKQEYTRFVFDNADYQRELDNIKHLVLE